ncbi:MAG: hypothetical protein WC982_09655 [Advenella sp.]
MTIAIITSLYQEWINAKSTENDARKRRTEIERQIVAAHGFDETKEGTTTKEDNGYKIKITGRITRKVDADKAREIAIEKGLDDQLSRLFRWKAEIDAKAWKSTDPALTGPFVAAIESKPGKPAVTITKIEQE